MPDKGVGRLIQIQDKTQCCGCGACQQVCPASCIMMKEDEEGFLYPAVDVAVCVHCGLCKAVCPVLHVGEERRPKAVYALKQRNSTVRQLSSSGGAFSLLAEPVIENGGICFGASFNERWEVVHDSADSKEKLQKLRRSKYVQSRIGMTYRQTYDLLKSGRRVLFSGTPCQIAGLMTFVRPEMRERLLTVELICHGVPSPSVWRDCVDAMTVGGEKTLSDLYFRDKCLGWRQSPYYYYYYCYDNGVSFVSDLFSRGFLENLYLRPICHVCPFRRFRSGADVTIGDFWGIENVLPEFEDRLGVSVMLVNCAEKLPPDIFKEAFVVPVTYEEALQKNICLEKSLLPHKKRKAFFERYGHEPVLPLIQELTRKSLYRRVRHKVGNILRWMGLR